MVAYQWLRRKLRALHTIVLLWVFIGLGRKLWGCVYLRDNDFGRCVAMFFAQDERERNITIRQLSKWLDEQGEKNETQQRKTE